MRKIMVENVVVDFNDLVELLPLIKSFKNGDGESVALAFNLYCPDSYEIYSREDSFWEFIHPHNAVARMERDGIILKDRLPQKRGGISHAL